MENEKKYSIDINELPSPKLFVGNLRPSRGFYMGVLQRG